MNPAALALGAMCQGVEPLEMALAYASFPAGGQVNTPICYTKVLDRNGNVLLEGKSEASEAINEGVAFIMTDVLQSVVKANHYGIDAVATGGKTGTTNDRYDIWFDGFTPSYAGAIWIGTDQNVEMDSMSYVAARLWGKIMGQIPGITDGEYSEKPDNVVEKGGEYYTEGTENNLSSYSGKSKKKSKDKDEDDNKDNKEEKPADQDDQKKSETEKPEAEKPAEDTGGSETPSDTPSEDPGTGGSDKPSDTGGTDTPEPTPTPDPEPTPTPEPTPDPPAEDGGSGGE